MNTEQAIQDTREGTKEAVKILADRIHNLEVKCENLEAENRGQAEEIFRLNSQVVELKRSEGTLYSGLNTSRDWEAQFERQLEALEERLAKPKNGVII